jgi:hypothetical protein
MPLIVLIPVVMVVATGSVVGVRWLYRHTSNGNGSRSIDDMTRNASERTKHVEEYTENVGERTKHVDEQTKNL